MKKIFVLLAIAAAVVGCTKHTTKYDNGNVDEYTYKDGVLTLNLPNGDGSDGTLVLRLSENDIATAYTYKFFKDWKRVYKGKTELDGIVRYIKSTAIDARPKTLANPMTAKYNGQQATMAVAESGDLWLFYDVVAKNAFGVEGAVPVTISLGKNAAEPVVL